MSDKPAFPLPDYMHYQSQDAASGLTRRELFAAMAMQGFAADPDTGDTGAAELANAAVAWADALIAELDK